jgi:HSP20 family protein
MQIFQKRPMNIIRYQRYPRVGFAGPDFAKNQWSTLLNEIDRVFDSSRGSLFRTPASFGSWSPALDLYQDKDQFTVVTDLPGLKKEEIEISLHDGVLTISGERKQEPKEGSKGYRTERFYGRFQRTVTLPASVDAEKVSAKYQDGILKVVLPKAEEAKPRQIEVSVD